MPGLEKFCQHQQGIPESNFLACIADKEHPGAICPYNASDLFIYGGEPRMSHSTEGKRTTPCPYFVLYAKFFCRYQFLAKEDEEAGKTSCEKAQKSAKCNFNSSGIYQDKKGRIKIGCETDGNYDICDDFEPTSKIKGLFHPKS